MPYLHWFTGAKGGVGKTLLSVLVGTNSVLAGKNVLLIDLNYNNADLFKVLAPIIDKQGLHQIPIPDTGFSAIRFSDNNHGVILVYPTEAAGSSIPMGTVGLYERLSVLIDLVESGDIERLGKLQPDDCIVDTGLHIHNLFSPSTSTNNFPIISKYSSKIWFVWTLSLIKSHTDLEPALQAIGWAEDNNWLELPDDIIHVLNLSNIHEVGLRAFFPSYTIKINEAEKLLFKSIAAPAVDFYPFANKAWKALKGETSSDARTQYKRILEDILYGNKKPSIFVERKSYRPKNLYPIPYYEMILDGYTANVGKPESPLKYDSFEELSENLDNIYKSLRHFISLYF